MWRADALVGREGLAGRRVADDLGEDLGRRDQRVEEVGRLAERERDRPHQRLSGLLERRVVLADGRPELRQPSRPQVRPAQAQPGGIVGPDLGRGLLAADVDLIAEVAAPVRVLVAQARVAAELRRMHVLDRQPLRLGKGEELLGDLPHAGHEVVRDAVTDEVGGADAVEGVAQRLDERHAGGAVRVRTEAGDVEDGERGRCAHCHQLMDRCVQRWLACSRPEPRHPTSRCPTRTATTSSLAALKGTTVVLYFYPKADTPGCTTQACGIRDHLPDYTAAGVRVLGRLARPRQGGQEVPRQAGAELHAAGRRGPRGV